MKKIAYLSIFILFIQTKLTAQNIGISAAGSTPHPSAMLDVSATDKGMLVPRMSSTQRGLIAAPAKGLLVFDNDTNSFWFYNGTAWTELSTGSPTNFWTANGSDIYNNNSGNVGIGITSPLDKLTVKNAGNGFTHTDGTIKLTTYLGSDGFGTTAGGWFGTATNHPMYFYTNGGLPKMTLLQNGFVGIGTTIPTSKLSVFTASSQYGFLQTDGLVSVGTWVGNGAGYFGTKTNHPLRFFTADGSTQMTVLTNGNVGIADASPVNRLQIGSMGAVGFNGNDIAFGNGTNAAGLAQTNSVLQVASSTDVVLMPRNGIGNVAINTSSAANKLQIGSMGAAGFNGNDFAIGNGTNALGVSQSNAITQFASSTNIALMPGINTGGGRVGINTTAPRANLEVRDYVPTAINGAYDYLNLGSSIQGIERCNNCTANISIRAESSMYAAEFDAYSDQRIKDITGRSNSKEDLQTINQLKITDYTLKDKVKYGNKTFKKVIAQEVEKVFPQIISKHTDFIPNVYQSTVNCEKTADGFLLHFNAQHNVSQQAKKIRLLLKGTHAMQDFDIVSIPSPTTVVIKASNLHGDNVFVYGEEVDDFRTVDYEGLTTLNISATQELSSLVKHQQALIEALEKRVQALEGKTKDTRLAHN